MRASGMSIQILSGLLIPAGDIRDRCIAVARGRIPCANESLSAIGAIAVGAQHAEAVASWNSVGDRGPSYNAESRKAQEPRQVLQELMPRIRDGFAVDPDIYTRLVEACGNLKALAEARRVYAHVREHVDQRSFQPNSLISMFAKCSSPEDARSVFDWMALKDVVSWNAMIVAYAQNGHCMEALELFEDMRVQGVAANEFTFLSALKACASPDALEQGKMLHNRAVESGFFSDRLVPTAVLSMYGKCGSVEDARRLFDELRDRDSNAITWNAMIAAYNHNRLYREAFHLYRQMQQEERRATKNTFVTMLNACVSPEALPEGRFIHAQIVESGYHRDVVAGTALVDMYAKCGSLEDARSVLDRMPERNIITWNTIIRAYARYSQGAEAFRLFEQMKLHNVAPNGETFVTVLAACADSEALAEGKLVHAAVVESEFESDAAVGTALLDMYGSCGCLEEACTMFSVIHPKDAAAWTAMAAAYAQQGHMLQALQTFRRMQLEGVKPNALTFATALGACGSISDGKLLHGCAAEGGFDSDPSVKLSLVNMYGMLKDLKQAQLIFDGMQERDMVAWNSMIELYAEHGQGNKAHELLERMEQDGVRPDHGTLQNFLLGYMNLYVTMTKEHDLLSLIDEQQQTRLIELLDRRGRLAIPDEV